MDITIEIAQDILEKAKKMGATDGDIIIVDGRSSDVQVRLSSIDKITDSQFKTLGLRLFFGKRSAISSTSDFTPSSLEKLIEDTCAIAKVTAHDEFAGLPLPQYKMKIKDVEVYDEAVHKITSEEMIEMAKTAEASALKYDERITNSDGGSCSKRFTHIIYAGTNNLSGEYMTSMFSISTTPIASAEGLMQRDYWYSSSRQFSKLDKPESIGETAARRTIRRLGARKIQTQQAPVVFDPETASTLLGNLCSALSGYSVYKGASFLVNMLNRQVAAPDVTIYDDGTIPWGIGSKPFDGEGAAARKTTIAERGILTNYLLDSYSARKLGLTSTGNASRGAGDPPVAAPTNFYLSAGRYTADEIIRSVDSGLYVTDLIGFGFNPVTGDYSRGASGIWIERGELAYPVEEITIAGNLKDMLMQIEMIGNDLDFRQKICSPTIKIGRLTIAGH
ncbi:MAG: TldD/PmbA family protein [Nitrospirae bacterium]|nr:TldD/PmbA family protein [Nitrospirota bacterium]